MGWRVRSHPHTRPTISAPPAPPSVIANDPALKLIRPAMRPTAIRRRGTQYRCARCSAAPVRPFLRPARRRATEPTSVMISPR